MNCLMFLPYAWRLVIQMESKFRPKYKYRTSYRIRIWYGAFCNKPNGFVGQNSIYWLMKWHLCQKLFSQTRVWGNNNWVKKICYSLYEYRHIFIRRKKKHQKLFICANILQRSYLMQKPQKRKRTLSETRHWSNLVRMSETTGLEA